MKRSQNNGLTWGDLKLQNEALKAQIEAMQKRLDGPRINCDKCRESLRSA